MKAIKELIRELTELQAVGVEYIEFVDTNRNNYYFECMEQSGAKDFGYLVLDTECNE